MIPYTKIKIEQFCSKWQVTELSFFGSVLRSDFKKESSDIDVLVQFSPSARWTLIDFAEMKDELEEMLGYPIDLVTKRSVENSRNSLRKSEILKTAKVIYDKAG